MATAADIGANFSDYQGNANLGGGNFGVVEINTRPLENLAAYTMLYNKEVWKQKQYETDLKVKELADLSKISLNSLRGKDKELLTKDFSKLITNASEYARKVPKNQQERMENELKWQTQLGGFMNNYGSGKQRAVSYYAQLSAIESEVSDAKTKDEKKKILDETFDKTGIDTPISAVPNFKTESLEIPKPSVQKFNSVIIEPNRNVAVGGTYFDPTVNIGLSDAAVLGINKLYPQEGTAEYDKLSPKEKDQARIQATIKSPSKVAQDATALLNPILAQYTNEKGVFDEIGFENDNASNTTVMNAYNGLKRLNDYSRDKFENGAIYDSQGLSVKLPTSFNKNNFKAGFIDFAKGVKPNQLVLAGMFAEYPGDEFKPVVSETDNARQNEELRLRWANFGLEKAKLNKADNEDLLAADGVLREITDIINKGDSPENQVDVIDGNTGKKKRVFTIGDPTILQKFGNVDKDGTTTNVPDEARYNPKTNEIDLVYYQKDDEGNPKGTQTGGHFIKEQKTLNSRTWANMVTQRTFVGQDKGKVNEIIQSVITKNGGDLYKIAKGLSGTPQTQQQAPDEDSKLTDAQYFIKYKKARKK